MAIFSAAESSKHSPRELGRSIAVGKPTALSETAMMRENVVVFHGLLVFAFKKKKFLLLRFSLQLCSSFPPISEQDKPEVGTPLVGKQRPYCESTLLRFSPQFRKYYEVQQKDLIVPWNCCCLFEAYPSFEFSQTAVNCNASNLCYAPIWKPVKVGLLESPAHNQSQRACRLLQPIRGRESPISRESREEPTHSSGAV